MDTRARTGRADALGAPFEVLEPSTPAVPVVVHVPHSSVVVPPRVRRELLLNEAELDAELHRMTDHHTDALVGGAGALGVTRFVNRRSRLVVDPERFDDPGAEELETVGMGAVYTATSHGLPLRVLTPAGRDELLAAYFHPYHAAFTAWVDRQLEMHGSCLIVDVHSYPSRALPYELRGDGPRPELCIGTDPTHTPDRLRDRVAELADQHGVTTGFDTPFRGTFVPARHIGDPRVRSVMLEIRRDTYLHEPTAELHEGFERMARVCRDVLAAVARPAPSTHQ